jgi:hypothetical protein
MISDLVALPAPESVLTAGNSLAAALVKFRKINRWWWHELNDLSLPDATTT